MPKWRAQGHLRRVHPQKKLAKAAALGADVLINRHEEDWGKAIFKATNRRGVDIVVDNVGAATFHTSLRALKKGGRLLTVGNTSGPKFELDNRLIFWQASQHYWQHHGQFV
ncbi:MAG: zinc-binding dehydrogenase [Ardenticatenaceae bacterium]|nr:zinc-binding dehydrogenase [Ardenticatenaceae bacterium]